MAIHQRMGLAGGAVLRYMQVSASRKTGGLRRINYNDLFSRLIVAFHALAGIMQPAT